MYPTEHLPRIAFTLGEVNGVGPEVLLKALADRRVRQICRPVVIGSLRLIGEYLNALPPDTVDASITEGVIHAGGGTVPILNLPSEAILSFGRADALSGRLAGQAITRAVAMCANRQAEAIVTMPVAKSALNAGGYPFPGHTEMLAALSGGARPLMILMTSGLRVALTTVHRPLVDVAAAISEELVLERLLQLRDSLRRDFAVAEPRIAVLALNPHAGESGQMGTEEIGAVNPAIRRARDQGLNAEGAYPADGFFARFVPDTYDAVLAMYHDQGLIPLKLLARGGGVNFTAGLPLIRTSPDHGTGFDIAGKGVADASGTVEAVLVAVEVWGNRGG